MSYERRNDRRSGGRPGAGRPDRGPRDHGGFGDRPPRDRPPRGPGGYGDRPPRERGGFTPRDEGGMSIRLDPRRLSALKLLAAEAGVRPGELVTSWVEERLDAARRGKPAAGDRKEMAELSARLDQLSRRVDQLAAAAGSAARPPEPTPEPQAEPAPPPTAPKRRGRPPKARPSAESDARNRPARVPLHEEIAAVISERGPMSAAELAGAIVERGRYRAPRSGKPLDAATVNSRVSNAAYRSRFVRSEGRIGLASGS